MVHSSILLNPAADGVCVNSHFLCDTGCRISAFQNMFHRTVSKFLSIFTVVAWHFCLFCMRIDCFFILNKSRPIPITIMQTGCNISQTKAITPLRHINMTLMDNARKRQSAAQKRIIFIAGQNCFIQRTLAIMSQSKIYSRPTEAGSAVCTRIPITIGIVRIFVAV